MTSMKQWRTDDINGWRFARHSAVCEQCDMAADAVPTDTGGLELHVDTGSLCDEGGKLLGAFEGSDDAKEEKSN